MEYWLRQVRLNWFSLIPRVMALIYGLLGLLFLILFVFFVSAFFIFDTPELSNAIEVFGIIFVLGTFALLIYAFLCLAKGFWFYEKWAPGSAMLLHSLFLFSNLLELWETKLAVPLETLGLILLNVVVILLLRVRPIRRLFQ